MKAFSMVIAAASTVAPMALNESQPSRIDVAAADKTVIALADSGFSGVVLIARGDSVLLHRAYGSPAHRPDTSSAFWIGSIAKGFTAAAILKLQESGRLSVRDTGARGATNTRTR